MGVRSRRREQRQPQQYQALLVALLLTAFALSGFGAGLVTRTVTSNVLTQSTAPVVSRRTDTPQVTSSLASASPTSSAPAVATVLAHSGFTLSADVSTRSLTPGQQFNVMVTATAADGIPVKGLSCYMRARGDGTPPLFEEWPQPQVTDNSGRAIWRLTTPNVAPGPYGLQVVAYGEHNWTYHYDVSVTVAGPNG